MALETLLNMRINRRDFFKLGAAFVISRFLGRIPLIGAKPPSDEELPKQEMFVGDLLGRVMDNTHKVIIYRNGVPVGIANDYIIGLWHDKEYNRPNPRGLAVSGKFEKAIKEAYGWLNVKIPMLGPRVLGKNEQWNYSVYRQTNGQKDLIVVMKGKYYWVQPDDNYNKNLYPDIIPEKMYVIAVNKETGRALLIKVDSNSYLEEKLSLNNLADYISKDKTLKKILASNGYLEILEQRWGISLGVSRTSNEKPTLPSTTNEGYNQTTQPQQSQTVIVNNYNNVTVIVGDRQKTQVPIAPYNNTGKAIPYNTTSIPSTEQPKKDWDLLGTLLKPPFNYALGIVASVLGGLAFWRWYRTRQKKTP